MADHGYNNESGDYRRIVQFEETPYRNATGGTTGGYTAAGTTGRYTSNRVMGGYTAAGAIGGYTASGATGYLATGATGYAAAAAMGGYANTAAPGPSQPSQRYRLPHSAGDRIFEHGPVQAPEFWHQGAAERTWNYVQSGAPTKGEHDKPRSTTRGDAELAEEREANMRREERRARGDYGDGDPGPSGRHHARDHSRRRHHSLDRRHSGRHHSPERHGHHKSKSHHKSDKHHKSDNHHKSDKHHKHEGHHKHGRHDSPERDHRRRH